MEEIASKLGIPPLKLQNLIEFESKWNPSAKNPYSSARGLIQFTNRTAQGMGYEDSLDLVNKNPTIEQQLKNPVYKYLKKYKPFKGDQSLFMAVFYPKARNWHQDKEFPEYVQKVNPGIKTPRDYIKKVYFVIGKKFAFPIGLLVGLSILYFVLKKME